LSGSGVAQLHPLGSVASIKLIRVFVKSGRPLLAPSLALALRAAFGVRARSRRASSNRTGVAIQPKSVDAHAAA